MHDCKGRQLAVGDIVLVPFTVREAQPTQEYCNVTLETIASLFPVAHKTTLLANTKQVMRANQGDETSYDIILGEGGVTLIA